MTYGVYPVARSCCIEFREEKSAAMNTEPPAQVGSHSEQPLPPTASIEERYSYLLRLWRSDDQWRASLQSVQSGERHMFADLESLLAFLVEQSSRPKS